MSISFLPHNIVKALNITLVECITAAHYSFSCVHTFPSDREGSSLSNLINLILAGYIHRVVVAPVRFWLTLHLNAYDRLMYRLCEIIAYYLSAFFRWSRDAPMMI